MMEMGIDDFALILSCEDDDKGEWTGNVDIIQKKTNMIRTHKRWF